MSDSTSLAGQVAIVTGASSGIGAATGRALARAGAAVSLAARRADRLHALERDIRAQGGRALTASTDVTARAQVTALVQRTVEAFGRVDILVNNAGIMPLAPLTAVKVEEWDQMIDVNVRGLLYAVAEVLPTMLEQGAGHIINVGSLAGRRPFYGGTVYSATKFAVRALSAGLRDELSSRHHIRVTDIEPGVVATELLDHTTDDSMRRAFAERWGDRTPLQADDIAEAILFAVTQPARVNVNELLVRPTEQET